jgi:hypothetical protein
MNADDADQVWIFVFVRVLFVCCGKRIFKTLTTK